MKILTHIIAFVMGVWVALEHPFIGHQIQNYAQLVLAWLSKFFGG